MIAPKKNLDRQIDLTKTPMALALIEQTENKELHGDTAYQNPHPKGG